MPSKNVTYGTNTITIVTAGDYEINYGITGTISPSATITLSVASNGTTLPGGIRSELFQGGQNSLVSGSFIATLAAGDVLTLRASANQDGTFTPADNVNGYLTVKQLN